MSLLNLYSAPILFGLALVTGAVLVIRRGNRRREWAVLAALSILGLAVWFGVRPVETTNQSTSLETYLAQGKPLLLEFQSPY